MPDVTPKTEQQLALFAVFDGRRHPDESPDEEPISGWDNWLASMENLRAALHSKDGAS